MPAVEGEFGRYKQLPPVLHCALPSELFPSVVESVNTHLCYKSVTCDKCMHVTFNIHYLYPAELYCMECMNDFKSAVIREVKAVYFLVAG